MITNDLTAADIYQRHRLSDDVAFLLSIVFLVLL